MNRFKFRIWDNKRKKFISTNEEFPGQFVLADDGRLMETDGYGNAEEYHDAIIQWWTGLKDANGKDIYEGDIIKIDGFEFGPRVVKPSKMTESHPLSALYSVGEEHGSLIEIIGNIFENKELIK